MKKTFRLIWLFVAALAVGSNAIAASTTSLPQQDDQTVVFKPTEAHQISVYFAQESPLPAAPSQVERLLLAGAPPSLTEGCVAMVGAWGAHARGSAQLTVKELAQTTGTVWLSYRCGSRRLELARYYSERLASLTPKNGTLRFFGLADGATDYRANLTLYHVAFAKELKLRGTEAAAFFIHTDGGNLCCATASPASEEKFLVIGDTPTGLRKLLFITTLRKRSVGEDRGTVHIVLYRARLSYESGPDGLLKSVTMHIARTASSKPDGTRAIRYTWDPSGVRFDEMRISSAPLAPPRMGTQAQ